MIKVVGVNKVIMKHDEQMTFNYYLKTAHKDAQYPEVAVIYYRYYHRKFNPVKCLYPTLGLIGESGESGGKWF